MWMLHACGCCTRGMEAGKEAELRKATKREEEEAAIATPLQIVPLLMAATAWEISVLP